MTSAVSAKPLRTLGKAIPTGVFSFRATLSAETADKIRKARRVFISISSAGYVKPFLTFLNILFNFVHRVDAFIRSLLLQLTYR